MTDYESHLQQLMDSLAPKAEPARPKQASWKTLFVVIVVSSLISSCLTLGICNQLFGRPAQVPNLSLVIGDLERIKNDLEWMATTIKSRHASYIISTPLLEEADERYSCVTGQFNRICITLEAMLSTGHDQASVETMQKWLAKAQEDHREFRTWFEALPRVIRSTPTQPTQELRSTSYLGDALAPFVELGKHFVDAMQEMNKIKRESLIEMLRKLRFKTWMEIPGRTKTISIRSL